MRFRLLLDFILRGKKRAKVILPSKTGEREREKGERGGKEERGVLSGGNEAVTYSLNTLLSIYCIPTFLKCSTHKTSSHMSCL